ncbi:MAG: hypothetical protein J4432_01020 [DPANN group archaeon]|nr:hypothetical protein [DPANN group archaeon]
MKIPIGSRGQEEAPVELLIAVTVLTFVLIVGFNTYNSLCASQYEQKLSGSMSKMARAIELVYRGATGTRINTQVDFTPLGGCGGDIEAVGLYPGPTQACRSQLGTDNCQILVARVATRTTVGQAAVVNYQARISETINIPRNVEIKQLLEEVGARTKVDCGIEQAERLDLTASACTWKPRTYGLSITKSSSNELTISG